MFLTRITCLLLLIFSCAVNATENKVPSKKSAVPNQTDASFAAGFIAASHYANVVGIDLEFLKAGFSQTRNRESSADKIKLQSVVTIFPKNKNDLKQLGEEQLELASSALGSLLALESIGYFPQSINIERYIKGFKQGYKKNVSSKKIAHHYLLLDQYHQAEKQKIAEAELIKSFDFLENNAQKKNIIKTASGLQYEILQEGKGKPPRIVDAVRVTAHHSSPSLPDGFIKAENFYNLRGDIPAGWRELFLLMKPGARYKVYLPPELGFRLEDEAMVEYLKPNEVLITEFTLLDIIPPIPVAQDTWQ
jgi:FKBP-type peptidyl-prolyl cis-trans isomerase